jgi:hypothetical protein
MTLKDLRRRLDRIVRAVRSGDWLADLSAPDAIVVLPGEPDPPGLADFVAAGGSVLRPDEPMPAHPVL